LDYGFTHVADGCVDMAAWPFGYGEILGAFGSHPQNLLACLVLL